MREYSPKRRTALVLAGSGTAGAYHAGVLKALDESGVKLDLLVGSGAGTVAAAYGAVAAGPKLYGTGGFWTGVRWGSFFRLRPALRVAVLLLSMCFGAFVLPLLLAILAGLLFPLLLLLDMAAPQWTAALVQEVSLLPAALRTPYLAALSVPVFALSALTLVWIVALALRYRQRLPEAVESPLDVRPGRRRLARGLWEIARGTVVAAAPPSEEELGRRYVGMLIENVGQPGFRELVLRVADLEAGGALPFAALQEPFRARFAASRTRGRGEVADVVDLAAAGYDALLFPAVMTGLLPPPAAPVVRAAFPRGGVHSAETHRLGDATLAGGCGITEALAAGAEQVILACPVPETPWPAPRRRGPRALADATLALLERQAVEGGLRSSERINRMVETLGHRTEDGGRAWEDPATGRLYRDFMLYVIRPQRRPLGPLELDGAREPATEVLQTTDDLLELGYRDAYRLFVEPVVGAAPDPQRPGRAEVDEARTIEL